MTVTCGRRVYSEGSQEEERGGKRNGMRERRDEEVRRLDGRRKRTVI